MKAETISRYTHLPVEDVRQWISQPSSIVYNDQKYLNAVRGLDAEYLEETLPLVREAYENHLTILKQRLQAYYDHPVDLMSAATLGTELLRVVQEPETALKIRDMHRPILGAPIRKSLQILLEILEEMPEGAEEWQQALCLLSFPMMNK